MGVNIALTGHRERKVELPDSYWSLVWIAVDKYLSTPQDPNLNETERSRLEIALDKIGKATSRS